MPPRARREERRVSPIGSYVPEPRHPPAYHAQPGQSTTIQPSGNTASYYPSDPAPIQPVQQPSSRHYDQYGYSQQPQYPYYDQNAYPQPPQEPLYDQWGYPQQSQGPYDDQYAHPQQSHVPYLNEYAHLQQAPNPYLTPSTVERTSYRQAPPDYAYDTHASAIPDQISGEYQQSSQYVPSYSQRKRQRSPSLDLWDLNASRPGSRGNPRDRHRQEETRTRRSGRDAFIGEAVVEPALATKKPKRRHGSSDIVTVTQALGQVSLTASAHGQVRGVQDQSEQEEAREAAKRAKRNEKERRGRATKKANEEALRQAGLSPPRVEKDPGVVRKQKAKKAATGKVRYDRIKQAERLDPELRKENAARNSARSREYNARQDAKLEILRQGIIEEQNRDNR